MTLNEFDKRRKEEAFCRAMCSFSHGHVSQNTLKELLVEDGFSDDEFKQVKKRLLYSGVIGIVYGNLTIENREAFDELIQE